MNEDLVVGIDLSTHGVKAQAIDERGDAVAETQATYDRVVAPGGVQEQPLEPVWKAVCEVLNRLTDETAPSPIAGLSITHQRGTVIALDSGGQPIGAAICDSDTRSWVQARRIQEKVGTNRLFQLTGCPPFPFNGLTKILWWRETFPDRVHRLGHWLSMQDWLVWRLTGELISSPGSAMRLGVLDIQHPWQYSEEILALTGIPESTLPRIAPFGVHLGRVRPTTRDETGLPDGLPVFASPGDQPAAVIGSGALADDLGLISLGTSFLSSFPCSEFGQILGDVSATMEVLPDSLYALEFGEGAGTNVLDWLRLTFLDLTQPYELDRLASTSPPGANGLMVFPHWWAIMDDQMAGSIDGLRSHHTRSDLVRATYESLVYELRRAWDRLEEWSGMTPLAAVTSGGGSSSRVLSQMIADVLKRPIQRSTLSECSARGAAVTAAYSLGWHNSIVDAARSMKPECDPVLPHQPMCDFYEKAYSEYCKRYG